MASGAHVVLVGAASDAAEWAESRLRQLEQLWSRFLPGSDLAVLAAAAPRPVPVSPETVELVEAMQLAAGITGGAYDPTLVRQLAAEGRPDRPGSPAPPVLTIGLGSADHSVADVVVDRRRGTASHPAGMALDPGGIGKGLAADIVVAGLLARGTAGALVCVGGDLAAEGEAPSQGGWPVAVADPHHADRDVVTVVVERGGVATSSTTTQRWCRDGAWRHHVIDPATGRCSTTDLASVTVVGTSGWLAEVHATAALLAGSRCFEAYMDRHRLAGVAVTADGGVLGAGVDPGTGSAPGRYAVR